MIFTQLVRADFCSNGKEVTVFYDPTQHDEREIAQLLNAGCHETLLDILMSKDISVMPTSHANFIMDEANKDSITTLPVQYLS